MLGDRPDTAVTIRGRRNINLGAGPASLPVDLGCRRRGGIVGLAAVKPIRDLHRLSRDLRRLLDHPAQRRLRQPCQPCQYRSTNDLGYGHGGRNRLRSDCRRDRSLNRINGGGIRASRRIGVEGLAMAGRCRGWPWCGRRDRRAQRCVGRIREAAVLPRDAGDDGRFRWRRPTPHRPKIDSDRKRHIQCFVRLKFAFWRPFAVLWTVAAVAISYFVFHETRFGAHVHATGDSAMHRAQAASRSFVCGLPSC